MSTHKHFDKICIVAVVVALLISIVFINGEAIGIQAADKTMGYEARLFDTGKVHTVDIVMDDWDSFIETCENEEYSACSIVIDGEAFGNVGIRAKGQLCYNSDFLFLHQSAIDVLSMTLTPTYSELIEKTNIL